MFDSVNQSISPEILQYSKDDIRDLTRQIISICKEIKDKCGHRNANILIEMTARKKISKSKHEIFLIEYLLGQ